MAKDEQFIVMEQGVYAGLDVEDPSKKRVQTEEELEEEIRQAVQENARNLAQK